MRAQLALMRQIDRDRTRMETAIALDTFESEPSRWARGSRPMPLESALALLRLELADHPERVTSGLRILCDGLDHEPIPVVDLDGEQDEHRAALRGVVAFLDASRGGRPAEIRATASELLHLLARIVEAPRG